MREKIADIYGYSLIQTDVVTNETHRIAPSSFKLDLRNVCKMDTTYHIPLSSISENDDIVKGKAKTLGQILFGTPGWKGLFEMRVKKSNDDTADIEIFLDDRANKLFPKEKEKFKYIIKKGLEILKKEEIISGYNWINTEKQELAP